MNDSKATQLTLTAFVDAANSNRAPVPLVIALVSFALIFAALASEFVTGEPPCRLCYIQRFPHVVTGLFALLAWQLRSDDILHLFFLALGIVASLFGTFLSVYHTGGELGLWDLSRACDVTAVASEEQVNSLFIAGGTSVDCAQSAWRLWHLPMTGYNVIASLGLSVLPALWIWALWPRLDLHDTRR